MFHWRERVVELGRLFFWLQKHYHGQNSKWTDDPGEEDDVK